MIIRTIIENRWKSPYIKLRVVLEELRKEITKLLKRDQFERLHSYVWAQTFSVVDSSQKLREHVSETVFSDHREFGERLIIWRGELTTYPRDVILKDGLKIVDEWLEYIAALEYWQQG